MNENDRKWMKMKENQRKSKKMTENERKWKKMIEKWRKMKNCKKKRKMKKKWKKKRNEKKKWKNEKMKKKNKTQKNEEKWRKKKEKWNNMDSHAKSSTISRIDSCCCNFFRQNPGRFPWFCFGMCLFPEENQQPILGENRFSEEKCQFSLDVKQKHTFYRRKSTKQKIAKVSPSNNKYSFKII